MFCLKCGQFIEEGKAFCKNCGSSAPKPQEGRAEQPLPPATADIAPPATVPSATAGPEPVPPPATPPAPSQQFAVPPQPTSPPPPAPPQQFAPPPPSGYTRGYAGQPQPGPAGPQRRTGLIVGIVVAAVIVLAGAGLGVYFGYFRDSDDSVETTTTVVAKSTTTTGADAGISTDGSSDFSADDGSLVDDDTSTFQMIPALDTSGGDLSGTEDSAGTDPAMEDAEAAFWTAATNLMVELEYCDARIPVLAEQINNTIPAVPVSVRDELSTMLAELDSFVAEVAIQNVPRGAAEAYEWLSEAAMHMGNRIYATIQGIQAVWDAGMVSSQAASFFDEGRKQRDAYWADMDRYYDLVLGIN